MYSSSRDLLGSVDYSPTRLLSSSYHPPSNLSRFKLPQTPPTFHRIPIDPVRKITQPEDVREEQRAAAQKYPTPYDRAYTYVEQCRNWRLPSRHGSAPGSFEDYEKPLSIKMPMKDWAKLSSDLDLFESDEAYPCLSYNASTSALIIQCMPSPLHESITSLLTEQILATKMFLPRNIQKMIYTKSGQDYRGFEGRWEGSKKRPDLAIEVKNAAGVPEVKWVLEVGFAETYKDLVDDVKLWLEGRSGVSMAVLVKFIETPTYRCPVSLDDDLKQLRIPLRESEVLFSDVTSEGEYGPAIYQGKTWVGQISEVIMEVWKRDANGLAKQHGDYMDLLDPANPSMQFQLSDFLTISPEDDRMISLDLDEFRDLLKGEVRQLVVDRCREMLCNSAKRMGVGQANTDYQPSDNSA